MLLYLQGQGGALRNEECNTGAHGCTPSGWSEKGKAQSQELGERPHFTGQEDEIHKRQKHSANGGDPAYHRHTRHCVGWINTKLFFSFWLHHAAYRILVPQRGIKPWALAVKVPRANYWIARECPEQLWNYWGGAVGRDRRWCINGKRMSHRQNRAAVWRVLFGVEN